MGNHSSKKKKQVGPGNQNAERGKAFHRTISDMEIVSNLSPALICQWLKKHPEMKKEMRQIIGEQEKEEQQGGSVSFNESVINAANALVTFDGDNSHSQTLRSSLMLKKLIYQPPKRNFSVISQTSSDGESSFLTSSAVTLKTVTSYTGKHFKHDQLKTAVVNDEVKAKPLNPKKRKSLKIGDRLIKNSLCITLNNGGGASGPGALERGLVSVDEDSATVSPTREDLLLELAKDIHNDLDVTTIIRKIMDSIGKLVPCEMCSFYFVDRHEHCLCAVVFENPEDAGQSETVKLKLGSGLAGYVGKNGGILNIEDAYEDERFDPKFDKIYGFRTKSVLVMPVLAPLHPEYGEGNGNEIIAVAQLINRIGEDKFTKYDEGIFDDFLTFCGIALKNAQLFELSRERYVESEIKSKENEYLLELAKSVLQAQTTEDTLENVRQSCVELMQAEKCTLWITVGKRTLRTVIENGTEVDISFGQGIAGSAAQLGEIINVTDAYQDERFNQEVDKESGFLTRSILAIPIQVTPYADDGRPARPQLMGVCQLVNKKMTDDGSKVDGHAVFTDADIKLAEAYASVCGVLLHKAKLQDEQMAVQQKLAFVVDLIAYHMIAKTVESDRLLSMKRPELEDFKNLCSWEFDPFIAFGEEPVDQSILATFCMFQDMGFQQHLQITDSCLFSFIATVEKNYRDVPYHNWMHGFSVAHTLFLIYKNSTFSNKLNSVLDVLAIYVACLCHDIDHRGRNNEFEAQEGNAMSSLYGTSILESHHFSQTVAVLSHRRTNVFSALSRKQHKRVISVIKGAIMATDLKEHFAKMKDLKGLAEGGYEENNESHKDLLVHLTMTVCDLNLMAAPWEASLKKTIAVYSEFFNQGDLEKQRGRAPIPMMDRDNIDEFANYQVEFICNVVLPAFKMLHALLPGVKGFINLLEDNLERWKALDEDRGLLRSIIQPNRFRNLSSAHYSSFELPQFKQMSETAQNSSSNVSKQSSNISVKLNVPPTKTVARKPSMSPTIASTTDSKTNIVNPHNEGEESSSTKRDLEEKSNEKEREKNPEEVDPENESRARCVKTGLLFPIGKIQRHMNLTFSEIRKVIIGAQQDQGEEEREEKGSTALSQDKKGKKSGGGGDQREGEAVKDSSSSGEEQKGEEGGSGTLLGSEDEEKKKVEEGKEGTRGAAESEEAMKVTDTAAVYGSAVVEYLTAELLDLAKRAAVNVHSREIKEGRGAGRKKSGDNSVKERKKKSNVTTNGSKAQESPAKDDQAVEDDAQGKNEKKKIEIGPMHLKLAVKGDEEMEIFLKKIIRGSASGEINGEGQAE
eukprot:Nk52_evm100s221 gene=Nk52_evmTU100s221